MVLSTEAENTAGCERDKLMPADSRTRLKEGLLVEMDMQTENTTECELDKLMATDKQGILDDTNHAKESTTECELDKLEAADTCSRKRHIMQALVDNAHDKQGLLDEVDIATEITTESEFVSVTATDTHSDERDRLMASKTYTHSDDTCNSSNHLSKNIAHNKQPLLLDEADSANTDFVATKKAAKEAKAAEAGEEAWDEDEAAAYRGLDTGWSWVVLVASFGTLVTNGCLTWAVGIMHLALLDRYHESVFVTSWAGSLNSALTCMAAPLSSFLIDRYSCRVAIMTSGVGYVIGYVGAAFAPNIWFAIVTCGIISGIAGGLAFTASMVVIGFNFHRRRNLALGIAHVGVGVGLFALAPLVQASREHYGTTGVFFILAAIAAQNIVFGQMCFPSSLEKHAHIKRKQAARKGTGNKQSLSSYISNYLNCICHKAVLCLAVGNFCYLIGVLIVYLHYPAYVVHSGFSATQASFLISLTGIMSAGGRLLTGIIANFKRIANIVLYSGTIGVVAVATILLPMYAGNLAGHVVFSVIMGLFFGSCFVLIVAVNIDIVGVNYMSAAVGFELCLGGMGSLVGPVFAGFFVDREGNYYRAILIAGSCMLLASVLSAVSACFKTNGDTTIVVTKEPDTCRTPAAEIVVVGEKAPLTL